MTFTSDHIRMIYMHGVHMVGVNEQKVNTVEPRLSERLCSRSHSDS